MKWTLLSALLISCTGCSGLMAGSGFTGGNGRILISGDAAGMSAFTEGMNGLITNGKSSPDADTSYWHQQRAKEVTKRMKFSVMKPARKGDQNAN